MRLSILGLLLLLTSEAKAVQLLESPSVTLTTSNVLIHWVTDVPCGTRARVEPANASVTVTEGKTPGTGHTVTVSGLHPATRYTVTLGTAKVWLATNAFTTTDSLRSAGVPGPRASPQTIVESKAPPARKTWGSYSTLPDHFERHGADFHAKNPEDYARMAWELRQRAYAEGLPAKVDSERVLRVYDPKTGAFAAYNPNGTTRTFFKPNSPDYFERQPGHLVNLKTFQSN
jgi:pyocin large subunit-like protein